MLENTSSIKWPACSKRPIPLPKGWSLYRDIIVFFLNKSLSQIWLLTYILKFEFSRHSSCHAWNYSSDSEKSSTKPKGLMKICLNKISHSLNFIRTPYACCWEEKATRSNRMKFRLDFTSWVPLIICRLHMSIETRERLRVRDLIERFFAVLLKNGHPGILHSTFFHQKS